ncbi:MAG: hypothetical protein CVU52_00075 [Deltaproteobacteria bacterium HGW-Deltaproteobacteria-10]|nr:MAG: hypothetical protein CVU52_00075 [Deltaproteobacteria bacterium HGW-Deltaproteobacteria-10]
MQEKCIDKDFCVYGKSNLQIIIQYYGLIFFQIIIITIENIEIFYNRQESQSKLGFPSKSGKMIIRKAQLYAA